jgi:hypothetical protein
MPSRRKSRFDKLFHRNAEQFVKDAMQLRRTILDAQLHLIPNCLHSRALDDVHDALLNAGTLPFTSFLGLGSAKLVKGTTQRFSTPIHRRQCP